MRLDKYLSQYAGLTRSTAKELIRKKRVLVNDTVCTDPGIKVGESDRVMCDGDPVIARTGPLFLVMNKPAGVITATTDSRERTVLDLIDPALSGNLSPVGRLDKDTTGLLVLTDDGQMLHRLLSPKNHVDKIYEAVLQKPLRGDEAKLFEQGLDIGDDKLTLPAALIQKKPQTALVILHEGRFHQVKRMFEAVDNKVISLKRLAMGNFTLPAELAEGEYRIMTQAEVLQLNVSKYQGSLI